MPLPYMGGLDRSLAFTALLDMQRRFPGEDIDAGPEAVTNLLENYSRWFGMFGREGKVEAGKTDLHTYAIIWVKTVYRPDE